MPKTGVDSGATVGGPKKDTDHAALFSDRSAVRTR